MGDIRILIGGSFESEQPETYFTAEAGGHANALQRAIEHLVDLLPAAIEKDHRLHEKGELPPSGYFGTIRIQR